MTADSRQNTRRALLAGVGLAAAAGGTWWALKRQTSVSTGGAGQTLAGDPVPADFWARQFDTPSGPALALSSLQGRPLLINFWATWCPPCVKEMPELDRFHREFSGQGWNVLGLAVDSPTPVKGFLAKKPVAFQIGLAGLGGTELAQELGNTAGGLPFSVLIDAQGGIRQRRMGATNFDELAAWAKAFVA
ncbi:TlpA disulfide reductase family protein [Aquabacterium sp. CECT 9606]|uniref:TlpA family protein disulfide reductase n=1 Tax=Aquabacterium sp. CECT 9606 TaxID=2845822 RepID=UPI001E5AC6BB|nr:TlpA disulfide reductase family protein [Aquabacterium sp. CECT 9606]CAH0351698.1 Thiol-disulfide oxidoreductase ResA [Aquabacterium sp. CECT 9606]